MTIQELLESIGVENAETVAKQLEEHIDKRIQSVEDEYEVKLADVATRLQEEADKAAQKELDEHKKNLVLWHKQILEQELTECDNQLKVAAEIRNVRSGMEKMIEGMKEMGIDTTQMFENVAASEVIALQDEIEALKESVEQQKYQSKAFQRAFIVSEATRDMADVERDKIIASADAIDESIEAKRFKSLVESLISVKKATSQKQEPVNESVAPSIDDDYGLKFQAAPRKERDISSYFM